MSNLDTRIGELRRIMEDLYINGEKGDALEVSYRLDRLIALAQRELLPEKAIPCAQEKSCRKASLGC